MLPYDGMTRTGSKGVSHSVTAETPSEGRKVLETGVKDKFYPLCTKRLSQHEMQSRISFVATAIENQTKADGDV